MGLDLACLRLGREGCYSTVLYMRTSIIQSDPLEALRTSYDSPIARRSCSKSHCWYNAVYSVYGRRVHACKIQGHTQSLCGRYARVCAGLMMARLHRHPQSRNDYAHGERYVITIYRRRPAREVQANDCTGCMRGARTQSDGALPGIQGQKHTPRLHSYIFQSTPVQPAAKAQLNETRSHGSLIPFRTCGSWAKYHCTVVRHQYMQASYEH